jgi:hypothetical protein
MSRHLNSALKQPLTLHNYVVILLQADRLLNKLAAYRDHNHLVTQKGGRSYALE